MMGSLDYEQRAVMNMHSQAFIKTNQYIWGVSSSVIYLHILLRIPSCTTTLLRYLLNPRSSLRHGPYYDRRAKTCPEHAPSGSFVFEVGMEGLLMLYI